MNVSRLRLITFDVTNTLLKFRSAPGQQYGEIGALYGILCDPGSLSSNFKAHWYKMNKEHPNFGLKTGLGWENWWKKIVIGTFKDSKFNLDDKKLEMIASHLIEAYKTTLCWQQSYGALPLLSYLRSRSVPMGIISNFDPRLEETLINTKLRHYFNFVISSYALGVEKPHPDMFTEAIRLSKVHNLKPKECLHVGDTVGLDYVGARNSGWNAALISDKSELELKGKHAEQINGEHVFSNLYDLHKFLITSNSTDSGQMRANM